MGTAHLNLAIAQSATDGQREPDRGDDVIEEIVVTDRLRERLSVDRSAIPKLTESLRDTPQSIKVLSRTLLDDRGAMSLNEALRNVPGITLGAGEFSWQGTNPSIRGFSARDDMFVDGIRDFGSYSRDPFNLETVEVLFGPSSVLFGRGSTGGAINQVTKQPTRQAMTELGVNIGSDETLRATADIARPVPLLGDGGAFRFNFLAHRGEVADRNGAKAERLGIAPSLSMGLDSSTQLTLDYMKLVSNNRPDYGLPWLGERPAPVPRRNFYGFRTDFLNTVSGIASGRLTHTINNSTHLDVQVRHARYTRESRITEPLITQQLTPATPLDDITVFRYVFRGDSEEALLTGQAAVTLNLRTGAIRHAVVTGLEASRETSAPVFAFGVGVPGTSLLRPSPNEAFSATNIDPRVRASTRGETLAIYALDTLSFGEAWQVTVATRWDRFDTDYDALRFAGPPTPFYTSTFSGEQSFDRLDEKLSYRAALVFRPTPATSLYAAGGTSFNPAAQSLSLLTSGRGLGVGNAQLDPEENRSVEAGIKADLRDGALSLTGALFEIVKTNARVPDPGNPGFNVLGGEHRIRGLSLDVNGMLSERLYLSSGYTYLDGEVVRAGEGAVPGAALAHVPEHSLSAWVNYRLMDRLDFGAGARYVSGQLAQNTGSGRSVPGYRLFDLMGRYRLSDTISLKLNLANITDQYYFEQLHPWHVVPGPGFTATIAVNAIY